MLLDNAIAKYLIAPNKNNANYWPNIRIPFFKIYAYFVNAAFNSYC